MLRLILPLMILSIIGCEKKDNEQSVSFTIINKSNNTIEKVDFLAGTSFNEQWSFSDSISFTQQIIPKDSAIFIWDEPKLNKHDGSFCIIVGNLESGIGYYSNGIILDGYSKYTLNVYNDSIE